MSQQSVTRTLASASGKRKETEIVTETETEAVTENENENENEIETETIEKGTVNAIETKGQTSRRKQLSRQSSGRGRR